MEKPVCVVVGVGPGNGAAIARRFAAEGYATALVARRPDLIVRQPRSAWSFEVEARPFGERW